MDLVALGIFLLAFLICSLLVFFISVYGTKEVSFEENLKASHGDGKKGKNHGQDAKKKAKKVAKITANSDNENQQQVKIFLDYFEINCIFMTLKRVRSKMGVLIKIRMFRIIELGFQL